MKQLIVNADDFGLSPGVNRAVIEGHQRGIITSATLMANLPGFREAVRLALACPSLGVGLHFNLTQGRPVAEASRVRSLTDARGEFLGTATALAWRSLAGRLRTEEIVVELRAQIERALAAGLRLTHLDGHQHAHAWPQVFEAVVRTLPGYGIQAVRLPRERLRLKGAQTSPQVIKQTAVAVGLAQLCRVDLKLLRQAGLRTADTFFGLAHTGYWAKPWLMDWLRNLPEGISELMCHPGYEEAAMQVVRTRLRRSREDELKLLTDPEVKALLRERGVELVNYAKAGEGAASPFGRGSSGGRDGVSLDSLCARSIKSSHTS